MKRFTEYLAESKRVYEFKIKIAGEAPVDSAKRLKAALGQFNVESCSSGKRTPIQETQVDFPSHKNINVTVFDVTTSYPATNLQIQNVVTSAFKLTDACVKVTNIHEEQEYALNHEHDEISKESLLGKEYKDTSAQNIVGATHSMNMLKELGKFKNQGTQYTGVNDQLLAKTVPTESVTIPTKADKKASMSPLGSKQVTLPKARG